MASGSALTRALSPFVPVNRNPSIMSPTLNYKSARPVSWFYAHTSVFQKIHFFFLNYSMLDYDTENLNSEEIYSSLRGVTEAIEKFSFRSQEDLNEPIKRDGKKDCDIVSIPGQGMAS